MEAHELTLVQAAERLDRKEVSSVELTRAVLKRVGALDPKVHAFITVDAEGALKAAADADVRRAQGYT
ncbi:MAG: Asp-tRNA(Asn)/Glu-tRNA(Gln) amidotransferase subunit GatA, partial [bacterium]